jgi:hypothetical protein
VAANAAQSGVHAQTRAAQGSGADDGFAIDEHFNK